MNASKTRRLPGLDPQTSPQFFNTLHRWLTGAAATALVALPLGLNAVIVNIDINGARGTDVDLGPTFVGQGAAGGGTIFNGLAADSRVGDGTDDDFITVTGTNLLDDNGAATTVGFTISPVSGGNSKTDSGVSADMAALLGDWVLVAYFQQAFDATADFTISGLGSGSFADLYFYARPDWPAGYTIPGATQATFAGTGGFTAANTKYFKDVPIVNGQITGIMQGIPSSPFLGIMSGLTIKTRPPGPFIKSTSPTGSGLGPNVPIKVEIYDYITQVNPSSVQVFLNGEAVSQVTSVKLPGTNVWAITAIPSGGFVQGATNTARIVFGDTSTPPVFTTNEWSFGVVDVATSSKVVNIDLNGFGDPASPAVLYVGLGAAGGGSTFNNIIVDSSLGEENLTVGGTNLLDSIGEPTTVSFTLSPVAGVRWSPFAASSDPASKDSLFGDYAAVSFGTQTTNAADFTISGLGSAPTVDLWFYHYEDPLSDVRFGGGLYLIPGAETFGFSEGIFNSGNTVYMKNVLVTNGTITGVFKASGYLASISGPNAEGASAGSWSGLTIKTPLAQPYVLTAQPRGDTVLPNAEIVIKLQDYVTAVKTNSIQLFVNDQAVTPVISKPAGSSVTTLNYTPPQGLIPEATNTMRVVFGNDATPPLVQTNDFSFMAINVGRASQIVNIDINGTGYSARPPGATYVGQGAAGGGSFFNGITADSSLPNTDYNATPPGPFDENITITGTNLKNSLGDPTAISFTIGPVLGADSGATPGQYSDNWAALNADWILVGYLGQTSRTADFTIGGLGDTPIVNLYFYTRDDPRDAGRFSCGTYIIPGTTGPVPFPGRGVFGPASTSPAHPVTYFRNVPVTGGNITGTFTNTSVLALMSGLTIELPMPQPYVKSYSPTGGGLASSTEIKIEIADYVTQVVPSSIQLLLNGQAVTPTVTKPAGNNVTTVSYIASEGLPPGDINVKLIFGDSASPQVVQTHEFSFNVLDVAKAAKIVNIDINGHRTGNPDPQTYVGQGAAGGGTVFNGLLAESAVGDGTDNDFVTVTGTNLKDSLGNATTVAFTVSPVSGGNSGAAEGVAPAFADLFGDWVLVAYFGQPVDGTADFVISGLGSATAADLYFYSRGDWPAGYTIGNESAVAFTPKGGFTTANTVYFKQVPVAGGQISGIVHGIPTGPRLGIFSGLTIDLNPPPAEPPGPLSVKLQGGQVAISWTGSGTLQSADAITGQWTDVTGNPSSPLMVSPSATQKFYRLRR